MDRVLVLNSDYTPINVTSLVRGFILVDKGKAELLKTGTTPIISGDKKYDRPLIIRLLSYVRFRIKSLRINRQRIFKRDNFRCAYCDSQKNLTIDHILPKSRGGDNSWINLITCCRNCNRYKDNKTPEEAGLKLKIKPYEPSIFSDVINPNISQIWEEFKQTY